MIPHELLDGLEPLVEELQALGISYVITGSVAGLAYGMYRSTADVDIVADLRPEHVNVLVSRLGASYYIDADMIYSDPHCQDKQEAISKVRFPPY